MTAKVDLEEGNGMREGIQDESSTVLKETSVAGRREDNERRSARAATVGWKMVGGLGTIFRLLEK